ncbi:MAG: hypothetical protein AAF810_03710 [Cyanobacteria bacterium P01_D01_bin.36]
MKLNIRLDLTDERVRLYLLGGLDRWVALGLVSAAQRQEIEVALMRSAERLPDRGPDGLQAVERSQTGITDFLDSEPTADPTADFGPEILSEPLIERTAAAEQVAAESVREASISLTGEVTDGPLNEQAEVLTVPVQAQPNWVSRAVSSLIEEISVIWLLFLGVFLVVVSSGVLAASQWDSFSAVGQYGVLFAYTLAFWGASVWTQRRENLQTTGRMLALTTMLLIPVNFWGMDLFGVLSSPLGLGLGFVAAIALTIFPLGLSAELMPRRTNRLNLIGLSWLHWGWGWAIWPVAATYLGTIGSAANLTYQDRQSEAASALGQEVSEPDDEDEADEDRANGDEAVQKRGLAFDVLTVALSIVILLVRSLWVAQVPPARLGLAAGICGWLLVWLTRHKLSRVVWERAGFGLLLLGWGVSVQGQPPLQAIAVSLLAVSLLWNKLKETWHRGYLLAVLGVGLQTYTLLWSILPTTVRDRFLTWLSTWFDVGVVQRVNWAGIGLFPFLLGMLLLAAYLRRKEQQNLSEISELLALGFGFVLTLMSVGNPFTCALNLLFSSVTLMAVLWRRQLRPNALVTLAHGLVLLTIVSWVYYFAPGLSEVSWAKVALGVAIAEGVGHVYVRQVHLQVNAWWATCGLSLVSYVLLMDYSQSPHWLWLVVPVLFTAIANHRRALYPNLAAGITMAALPLQVPWMTAWPISIVSFAIGSVCTGLNSRVWRHPFAAFFSVGMGLSLVSSLAWVSFIRPLDHSLSRLMVLVVVEIWALWLVQRNLSRRTYETAGEMAGLYEVATRTWGALLMVAFLSLGTGITLLCLFVPVDLTGVDAVVPRYVMASAVILLAAIAECIRNRPMEWRYWSLAWTTAITVSLGTMLSQFPALSVAPVDVGAMGLDPLTLARAGSIAIATIALAFMVQIAGDVWVRLKQSPYRSSWHDIPLAYAGLGLLLGHLSFQADTGFFSVSVGLLLLGIGRRKSEFKYWSYGGLAAITFGAYELLVYRLLQASGGSEGDGVTLLALLALALTVGYRILSPLVARYFKLTPRALGLTTHVHWALGSVLCVVASVAELSQPRGIALWTGCSLLLCAYALSVGNRRWTQDTFVLKYDVWTWLGIAGALLCIAYDRFVWFPDRTGLFVWGGAIACVIGYALYCIPWERLGWGEPWRTTGIWLPVLTLGITVTSVQTQGVLAVAAFYAWLAKRTGRVGVNYFSVGTAAFCLVLGHLSFGPNTGLFTLAVGALLLYIGRQQGELKLFSFVGLAAVTAGAYELLIYQLLQASGGSEGDGITLLALLALALTAVYRGLNRWLPRLLGVTPRDFGMVTHAHWLLGSVLCVVASAAELSQPRGIALWTGCSLLLCGYALGVGNRRWTQNTFVLKYDVWTWLGIVGALLCIAYNRFVWFPDRTGLLAWGGLLACVIGFVLYSVSWERFGWSEPLRTTGIWLPVYALGITFTVVQTQGLLLVGAFYAWMAKQTSRVRLSYLSIVLFDFALLDYLAVRGGLTPMVLSLAGGLSVLYVAEIDPYFRQQSRRQQRHWLRILASGLVGITALYQTEVSVPMLVYAAIAAVLGLAFVFAGLILKVRAFLYVGTVTFVVQVLRVLWLFVNANSLLLWAVGIVLGLVFIWVAATFESKRSQVISQLSSWTAALESWD